MVKLEIIVIIQYGAAAHHIAKKIHPVFHNGSNYDYHFMIKKFPPGNKTSWLRHNNVSLYIPVTLQVCLK